MPNTENEIMKYELQRLHSVCREKDSIIKELIEGLHYFHIQRAVLFSDIQKLIKKAREHLG